MTAPKPPHPPPEASGPPEPAGGAEEFSGTGGSGSGGSGAVGSGTGSASARSERRLLVLSSVAAVLGLGAVAWVVRGATPEVPIISAAESAAPITDSVADTLSMPAASAEATAEAGANAEAGALDALGLDIPTGFDPPQLSGLNFAQSFAKAAAYRGWKCQRPQVVLFSDARQAIPAVQEGLLRLGYQVSDTPPALGEDSSWVARHANKPTLFGSFSSGPEGRGNVSVCRIEP